MGEIQGIVIVETFGLIRACLSALIAGFDDLEILASMEDFHQAMLAIAALRPRLVLVGVSTPLTRTVDFLRNVKYTHPEVRVLALTLTDGYENVDACIEAGADGYLFREANHAEFAAAIRSALDGGSYRNAKRTADVFGNNMHDRYSMRSFDTFNTLTPREREVLRLVASAYSNKAIATKFGVSVSTVEKHRSNMLKKLSLHNVAEVTAYAIKRGWVSPQDAHRR